MSRPFSTNEKFQLLAGSPQCHLVLFAIVFVIAISRWLFPPVSPPALPVTDTDYRVLRVIDGDTVLLADQTRVRLIGINAQNWSETVDLPKHGRKNPRIGCVASLKMKRSAWSSISSDLINTTELWLTSILGKLSSTKK